MKLSASAGKAKGRWRAGGRVRDNPEEHRFELMVEGQRAEAYTARRARS